MLGDYLEEKDRLSLYGQKYVYNFIYNILFAILLGNIFCWIPSWLTFLSFIIYFMYTLFSHLLMLFIYF